MKYWPTSSLLRGFVGSLIGTSLVVVIVALGLLAYHSYQDHLAVHAVIQFINNAQQQRAPAAVAPAAPVKPTP